MNLLTPIVIHHKHWWNRPAIRHLMPKMEDIPEEFKEIRSENKWVRFINDWFFHGIKTEIVKTKEGIDKETAFDHLMEIISSFEPPHEHKIAACAFLASMWFEDVEYKTGK